MSWASNGSQGVEDSRDMEDSRDFPEFDPGVQSLQNTEMPRLDADALYLDQLPLLDMTWIPGLAHPEDLRRPTNEQAGDNIDPETPFVDADMMPISNSVFSDLLDVYFEKVQGFLPLFHQPTFSAEIGSALVSPSQTKTSPMEGAFILNGMFALSARFSLLDCFADTAPTSRGEPFAKRAVDVFDRHLADSPDMPSLRVLQGSILLACYYLSSGITSRAWRFTGVCIRMAYELNIHKMDHHHVVGGVVETAEAWVKSEEKRRAWWSAWELDNFASTVSCRPYCCDRQVEVLLPVSDDDWFEGRPVKSALLWTNRQAAWESLADCDNQSPRAWFLVAVHLIRLATDIATLSNMESSSARQKEFETAVTCFPMALPSTFDLSRLSFNRDTWAKSAWIVSTHIMFQSACSNYILWREKKADNVATHPRKNFESQPGTTSIGGGDCRVHANEVVNALRTWDPRYMPFSPFVACSILGPQSSHLQNCTNPSSEGPSTEPGSPDPNIEILRLCLKRHARYWELGSLLLEIVRINSKFRNKTKVEISPEERGFLDRLPILAVH